MLRLHAPLLDALGAWIARQKPPPSRPEAIRRLLEQALAVAPYWVGQGGSRRKAAEMAGRTIDRLADRAATDEQRAHRKRRLIKGPREFRDVLDDQPKKKG
jgi:hypothetical protein